MRLCRLVILALPFALLVVVAARSAAPANMLWLGALFQALAVALLLCSRGVGTEPSSPALIMMYVIALSWLLFGVAGRADWVVHLAQALLLVVPLGLFGQQCLRDSGATAMRRARQLAARLGARTKWPANLMECRRLPEVKALRESLHVDASPALELLVNPRPAVRVAALAALEFRPAWRPGQPEVVLQLARRSPEPEVRAAAVNALANVEDRLLVESLAELLRDPSPLVRETTTEALLWNCEQRWGWVRHALRHALADPACQEDGALKLSSTSLTPEAINDLTSWAGERGGIAVRAALTLGVHYHQLLASGACPEVLPRLRRQLTDPHTPAMWRLELARLLSHFRELDERDLRQILAPSMPAPVRLIAVEALLAEGPCPEAVAALHDLARLPNREIALATADVLQRRLGVDLGLPRGGPLPAVHSRAAADVARRLQVWVAQNEMMADPPPHEEMTPREYDDVRPSGSTSRVNL